MRRHHGSGRHVDDVQQGGPVGVGDVDHHTELVHASENPRAESAEARRGVTPNGYRADVPLPRQARGAECVVTQMHQHDHADATLVPGIDAIDVTTHRVGALDAEHHRRHALRPGLHQTVGRPGDDSSGIAGLSLDQGELCLDSIPWTPAEIPACDDRIADSLGDHRIDPSLAQHVETDLVRRTKRDTAPHGAERLRYEPRAVGVQIKHERPAMDPFRLGVDCRRHGGYASNTTVRSLTVASDAPSPQSGRSARSAWRSRCQIALPRRSSSVDA
jgi:hypothetical protein